MQTKEGLSESLEDYLETIYNIIVEKTAVRVKDIAATMNVRYPSVTAALKVLEKRGFINYEPYGIISLTKLGLDVALDVSERHRLLQTFFENTLGIDSAIANQNACRMEHVLSREVYDRFVQFVKFVYVSQDKNTSLIQEFNNFSASKDGKKPTAKGLEKYFDGTGFDLKES